MDESRTDDIPQVSIEENNLITAKYSEEELGKLFFKWSIIKHRVRMVS
jgi:hypothetical protein